MWVDLSDGPRTEVRNGRFINRIILQNDTDFVKVLYAKYHGQGKQDQEIGSIKTLVSSAVRAHHKMTTPEKLEQYLTKEAQPKAGSKIDHRYFSVIDSGRIPRTINPPTLDAGMTNNLFCKNPADGTIFRRPIFCAERSYLFEKNHAKCTKISLRGKFVSKNKKYSR